MHQHDPRPLSENFCHDCLMETLEYFKRLLGIMTYNNGGEVTLDTRVDLEGCYLDYTELDDNRIKINLKRHNPLN